MAEIVQLPLTGALRTPIGHAIRTGEFSYRRLEDLRAKGHLPARAVIVDASKARFQKEFIRSLEACGDRDCCPRGPTSTLENHRSHIARRKFRAIDALFEVPDTRRIDHFINGELRAAERPARDPVHLDIDDGRPNKALPHWRKRIDSMTRMFETLSEGIRPSPPPLKMRQGPRAPTHRSSA